MSKSEPEPTSVSQPIDHVEKREKKRLKKSKKSKDSKQAETQNKPKTKQSNKEKSNVVTDLLTNIPQLTLSEVGGGEGLGDGVVIYKKQLFIPRKSKIEIYHTNTQVLMATLTPKLSTEITSILKIQLSPVDQTLFCLTSDGRVHKWSSPYNKYLGYFQIGKTILDFQFTQTALDASSFQINFMVRDDSYTNSTKLEFKTKEAESRWKNYFNQREKENEFANYVVSFDQEKSDSEPIVGTTKKSSQDPNLKVDQINDGPFLQSLPREVSGWHLKNIVRIPRNCVLFNGQSGYPNVLFSFVDETIILIVPSKNTYESYKHSRSITCVALHPTLPQFAYADTWGKILLNQFTINDNELKIFSPNCTLHWHSQAVTSLCYLSSGIHLLSGGKEPVLVQWNLVEGTTRLLPRLPNSIQAISPHGSQSAAIRCDDGSVTVVRDIPHFQQLKTFKGIDTPSDLPPLVNWNPRTSELAMVTQNDQLTFFNPKSQQISETLATANLNKFQQTNSKQQMTDPRITQLVFSKDGDWIVTSEYWNPVGFPSQCSLKFWNFDTPSNAYKLTTQIMDPHKGEITSLQLVNHLKAGLMAISLGSDNLVRTWTCSTGEDQEFTWACSVTHEHPKNNTLIHLDTSSDGTLCALTSDTKVVLWDPFTNSTLTYLSPSLLLPDLVKALFVPKTPYLVLQGTSHVTLFNLVDKSQVWSLELRPQQIFIDSDFGLINCIVPNNGETARLITFEPKKAQPLMHCVIPLYSGVPPSIVIGAGESYQIPKSTLKVSTIYLVDGDRSVYRVGKRSATAKSAKNEKVAAVAEVSDDEVELASTNVRAGAKRNNAGEVKSGSFSFIPNLSTFFQMLTAPSHMLPSCQQLFRGLIQNILPPKTNELESQDVSIEVNGVATETTNPTSEDTQSKEAISLDSASIQKLDELASIPPNDDELATYLSTHAPKDTSSTHEESKVQNGSTPKKSKATTKS